MTVTALTISDAAAQLRSGALSSVQLTQAVIAQADRVDETFGIYLHRRDQDALADAERADTDFASGVDRGPLQGIPGCAPRTRISKRPTGSCVSRRLPADR